MVLKNILVTGGSGLLGSQLVSEWSDTPGIKVVAPPRKELDIAHTQSVSRYFSQHTFEIVVHCAAYTDTVEAMDEVEKCVMTNVIGTWNMLREAMKNQSRFVFISTDYVFDGKKGNYRIDDPINPIGNYAMSKGAAELIARMYNNSLSIRTSFVPSEFPHPAAFTDQYTTRDYVDIISSTIRTLSLSQKTGISHVGTSRKSVFELAKKRKKNVKKISIKDVDFYLPPDTSLLDLAN